MRGRSSTSSGRGVHGTPGRVSSWIRENALGLTALFVALSGTSTSWAAAQIGAEDIEDNAVRSNHIKDGEVRTPDLAGGAVTSAKVRDGSLLYGDLKRGQVYSAKFVNATFLKIADAYDKADIDQLLTERVAGRASVLAGFEIASGEDPVAVLDLPGLVRLEGDPFGQRQGPSITIVNESGSPLGYGVPDTAGVIPGDGSVDIALGGPDTAPIATLQLVSIDLGLVATLELNAIPEFGGGTAFAASAIIVYD